MARKSGRRKRGEGIMSYKPVKLCVMLNEENAEYLVSHGYHKATVSLVANTQEGALRAIEDEYQASRQAQECVWLLALNAKLGVIGTFEISRGAVACTCCSTRDVMRDALMCGAVKIILIHNHPSGDSHPSKEDIELTKKLIEAGKVVDVCLVDHIVIGSTLKYYSMYQNLPDLFE